MIEGDHGEEIMISIYLKKRYPTQTLVNLNV